MHPLSTQWARIRHPLSTRCSLLGVHKQYEHKVNAMRMQGECNAKVRGMQCESEEDTRESEAEIAILGVIEDNC